MSTFGLVSGAAGLRNLARVAALGGAALLASCGGGTQVEAFSPQRVLVFGDETSVITTDGRKYTVNALKTDGVTFDCATNPIWVQTVASSFGLVFPQCNPDNVASPRSRILATAGARVADLTAQVDCLFDSAQCAAGTDAETAGSGFSSKDLTTVLVGTHDVLDIYAQYPGISIDQAKALAETKGAELAVQVNRIAAAGGKVLLGKVLDLGQTPFGLAEKANNTDTDRAALLTTLAARFNAKLRVDIVNDGRKIGLVQTDERIQTMVSFPGSFGFSNVTEAACLSTVVAPNCTTADMVTDSSGNLATASGWLWADSLNLSAGGQFRLGEIGASVAVNNPF